MTITDQWAPPTASQKVARARLDKVDKTWSENDKYRAIALSVVGFSLAEIADDLSRTEASVQSWFSKQGLKPSKLRCAIV